MIGLLVAGFGGYALRALLAGRRRHERTEADGGSVLLGKSVMETAYWLMEPVVALVAATGVSPNAVTLFSLVPALGAGVALGAGWFGLAAVLAATAQFADIIDGLLARRLGVASDAGEVIDAAVDRYVELLFLGGLAVHFRAHGMLLVVLAAIGGAFMVSYSTAKAEAMGVKAPRGAMRHAERGSYLILGAALTPFAGLLFAGSSSQLVRELPIVIVVTLVAVGANVSVARRFAAIARALRARDTPPARTGVARVEPPLMAEADGPVEVV